MSEDTTAAETEAPETVEDFDAFWATRNRNRKVRTTTIRGVTVALPPSLPLQFELEAKRLNRSKAKKDVQKLLAILLGEETLTALIKAGMDLEQFTVLLAWAPQVIAGVPVTLQEVADQIDAMEGSGASSGEA